MTPVSFVAESVVLPLFVAIVAGIVVAVLTKISLKTNLIIAAGVFFVALLVSVLVSLNHTPGPRLIVEGTVVDEASNNGIGQAIVSLSDDGKSCTSVDNGNFLMDLTGVVKESQRIRIRVTKDGYKPYDGTVAVPAHDFVVPLHHL